MRKNNMKKIFSKILAMIFIGVIATSCSTSDDPYFSASPDDVPRILQPEEFQNGKNGEPALFASIKTDENFKVSIIVTPADYTTCEWFDEGWFSEPFAKGTDVEHHLMAGEHIIKVVATTTAGKSTFRRVKVKVGALDTDPAITKDDRSRYFMPGETHEAEAKNAANVKAIRLYLLDENGNATGDVEEITSVTATDNKLTFAVPAITEGTYRAILVTNDNEGYATDVVKVSSEEYVAPGVEKITLFDGNADVPSWTIDKTNWGGVSDQLLGLINEGKVTPGTMLHIEIGNVQDGAVVAIINEWWKGITTGGSDSDPQGRGDIAPTPDQTNIDIELTELAIQNIKNAGFYLTGQNYQINKIELEVQTAVETVLFDDCADVPSWTIDKANWEGMSNQLLGLINNGKVKEGSILTIEIGEIGDGAVVAIINEWWKGITTGGSDSDPQGRGDIAPTPDQTKITIELTDLAIENIKNAGFYLTGQNYKIYKVSVK